MRKVDLKIYKNVIIRHINANRNKSRNNICFVVQLNTFNMSKIDVLSKLLFFTIFVLSTTYANPAVLPSRYRFDAIDSSDFGMNEVCFEMMKLKDIPRLYLKRNLTEFVHNMGCAFRCEFEKRGWITDNKIDLEKIGQIFDSQLVGVLSLEDTWGYFETCVNETNAKTFTDNCDMFTYANDCILRRMYNITD